MSDGPHRTLKMSAAWKQLAKCAANEAYAPEDVSARLPKALSDDWQADIPARFFRQVQSILCEGQTTLFEDRRAEKLDALRREAVGQLFANVLLDYADQAVAKGGRGLDALREVMSDAVSDWANRRVAQVEEHYHRDAGQRSAVHVRERLENTLRQADLAGIADNMAGLDTGDKPRAPEKQSDVDDGVKI